MECALVIPGLITPRLDHSKWAMFDAEVFISNTVPKAVACVLIIQVLQPYACAGLHDALFLTWLTV